MDIRLPFDKDGCRIAVIVAVVAVLLGHISTNLGWFGFLLAVGCLLFFRDPDRLPPSKTSVAVSPADGIVLKIQESAPPEELDLKGPRKKISIFMSLFNVHVNRSPVVGVVEKMVYVPGKFFNVTLDKASDFNERQVIQVKTADGVKVVFVQIAGLIARRIRCDVAEGDELALGQRIGLIRFGSRLDVYLPMDAEILMEEGQVTVAGETVLANLKKKAGK
ncbi:MAG: phosphatidylserine decarboxylase [Holosporaceae bacterium]|jgi:phosphatidylserine decarboxylase|nr:phosphatidylserine decarboxylase [Holosporaceae bacterium]